MPDTWKQHLTIWKRRFRAFGKATFSIAVALVGIAGVGAGAFAIYFYWNWLNPVIMGNNPEHLRNLILMTAGLITFVISIWRARIADKQASIAEKKQLTDRFIRSTEQLGKSGKNFLFLRIGAIHALEHIGNDSRDNLRAIIFLLSEFARATSIVWNRTVRNEQDPSATVPLDIAEAVKALARLNDKHLEFLHEQKILIDLSDSCFPRLSLPKSNLTRFKLTGCDLSNADFWETNLRDTDFLSANLFNAILWSADLRNASFHDADLRKAEFWEADLRNASLWGADLSNTSFVRAKLQGINIHGAEIQDTEFGGANIADINRDSETGKIREGTTDLLSGITYHKNNPPQNCPEGVELPPPREDED